MDLAELHVPRSVAYVGLARLVVASAARLAGLSDERLEDLKIAVSEAAAQAVTAARGMPDGSLTLAFGPYRGAFEVHVLSPGMGLAGRDTGLREWSGEGGLGLTLMEGLADEVVFPEASGGQLVLRFRMADAGKPLASAASDTSPV